MNSHKLQTDVRHLGEYLASECKSGTERPLSSSQRLILRHEILCQREGYDTGPLEITRIVNCSYESVRRILKESPQDVIHEDRAFFGPGILARQIFDLINRHNGTDAHLFYSSTKRAILSRILLRPEITLQNLRREFRISHESLRILVKDGVDCGLLKIKKVKGRNTVSATALLHSTFRVRGSLTNEICYAIKQFEQSYVRIANDIASRRIDIS